MPADTSPTMRPVLSRTGATARIDGPSVPVYTSLNVSPRSAGSMVPMYFPPIWVGSVWVNRVRSGAMIVMKAMSVFLRTASVTGCKVSVALPDSIAVAVDGESASAVAMPRTCWRAAASPSRRASNSASALPASTTTAITRICSAIA